MDGGTDSRRITLHTPGDFSGMRAAGQLAAATLDMITSHVVPGVTTGRLDALCHEFIVSHGAVPAPLNYRGYPKSICTSINHVVCHGIPGREAACRTATSSTSTSRPSSTAGTATPAACSSPAMSAVNARQAPAA